MVKTMNKNTKFMAMLIAAMTTLTPMTAFAKPVKSNVHAAKFVNMAEKRVLPARSGVSRVIANMIPTPDEMARIEEQKAAEVAAAQKAAEEAAAEQARIAAEEERARQERIAAEQALCDNAPVNIPAVANRTAHPYMPYKAVTSRGTVQYKLLHGADAHSDVVTGLRMVGERYCIAIGQGYGLRAGDKVDVVLEDGTYIKCIVGDMKAIVDTDPTRKYQNTDRNVVEMIVDYRVFHKNPDQYLTLFGGKKVVKLVKATDF